MIDEHGAPLVEPDRAYWRRRVNRRVHTHRRWRSALRWGGILAANVGALVLLLYLVAGAVRTVREADEFDVAAIRVAGTSRLAPDAVRDTVSAHLGENIFDLDLDRVASDASAHPWIREVRVKRILPSTLRLEVVERNPAAQARVDGGGAVVDETGRVLGRSGPGVAFDLPVLTGLDGIDDAARAERVARGVATLDALRRAAPRWAENLSEVDLSRPDRTEVVSSADAPRLLLDVDRPARNLERWLALRPSLERRMGPFRTVDLRWDGRIVVLPAEPLSPSGRE